ncbi:uncharacterized protein LOC143290801 [Babylonia areolata]|uniref:uncharacterized protein LOC143290801 n=1 Tax=Babylonia areolata TaxID=304850 RepID=UPI003FD27ABA
MWLPITYVCVTMVMAVLGNSLVLVVFKCRWRSSGSTETYVVALAILDLLCALVSLPRELLPLAADLSGQDLTAVELCRVATFLVYLLNLTSGFILVAIAITRFVKVSDEGSSFVGVQDRVWVRVFKVRMLRFGRALRSARGAKVATGVCFSVAVCFTCPTLVFFAPAWTAATSGCGHNDTCTTCYQFWDTTYTQETRRYKLVLLLVCLVITAILTALYVTIVRRIRASRDSADAEPGARGPGFKSGQPARLGPHDSMPLGAHQPVSRTQSEPDTRAAKAKKASDPGHRSVSVGDAHALKAGPEDDRDLLMSLTFGSSHKAENDQRLREEAVMDSEHSDQQGPDLNTNFPPVSYTAQQISLIGSRRNVVEEDVKPPFQRPSVASFQFSKQGNRMMMTTFVFLCVTVVFILSYVPYFVVRLSSSEPDSSVLGVLVRSYLISNAANPLVYTICNPYFRSTMWKMLIFRREVI